MSLSPRPTRGWLWFFALLAALSIVWTAGSMMFERYYWGTAVTKEALAQARARWRAHGAKDYDLDVVRQGTSPDRIVVRVRNGQVVYAEPDERPLAEKRESYGVPALFDMVQRLLDRDTEAGAPVAKAIARFDPYDGHLTRYTHHVKGSGEEFLLIVKTYQPQKERTP